MAGNCTVALGSISVEPRVRLFIILFLIAFLVDQDLLTALVRGKLYPIMEICLIKYHSQGAF